MKYVEPMIMSYSEEALEKLMVAFASPCSGGTFCEAGTQYSQACGSAANYCSSAANYTGSGPTPRPCTQTSSYVGSNSITTII